MSNKNKRVYKKRDELKEKLEAVWDCCERNCARYFSCGLISQLDEIFKQIWD